ncbi:hypothetical protein GCM10022215_27990 [Nocardioides fonticola]|uniref:Putative Flp pilus-assembly TadG-like N-terminal domain-containing protein n=1 Tax=Nocardioides fonticola TaxID=450363 RepID=A0ABP7XMS1_9ACTN
MTPRCDRRREERGAATVLATGLAVVLLLLGCACTEAVGLVRSHRIAQSAADLAALAAAAARSCAPASTIAERNGARLTSCTFDGAGLAASVTVEVDADHWLGPPATLTGRARAGPSSLVPGGPVRPGGPGPISGLGSVG